MIMTLTSEVAVDSLTRGFILTSSFPKLSDLFPGYFVWWLHNLGPRFDMQGVDDTATLTESTTEWP